MLETGSDGRFCTLATRRGVPRLDFNRPLRATGRCEASSFGIAGVAHVRPADEELIVTKLVSRVSTRTIVYWDSEALHLFHRLDRFNSDLKKNSTL